MMTSGQTGFFFTAISAPQGRGIASAEAIPPASIENDFGRIRQLVQPRTQRLTAHVLIQRVRQRIVNRIRHLNRAAFGIAQVIQNVHPASLTIGSLQQPGCAMRSLNAAATNFSSHTTESRCT